MNLGNQTLRLPSGAVAVRVGDDYHFGPVGMVVLTAADVEALFGDSIADDGGRELPASPAVGAPAREMQSLATVSPVVRARRAVLGRGQGAAMTSVEQRFRLPFVLPSFNDIEAAARRRTSRTSNAYADLKAQLQPVIVGCIVKAKLRPVQPGVLVVFHWLELDRRRDPLDIRPACKLVLDALGEPDRKGDKQARAGILHCDGWHCIAGVIDHFGVSGNRPGIEVTVVGRLRVPRARSPEGWPFEVRR